MPHKHNNLLYQIWGRQSCMRAPLFLDDFPVPVNDTAKFINVCISHIGKFLSSFLTAPSAAAIYKDDLIKIGKFLGRFRFDAFIRNKDGSGNMAFGVLIFPADIYYHMPVILCHHLFCLIL